MLDFSGLGYLHWLPQATIDYPWADFPEMFVEGTDPPLFVKEVVRGDEIGYDPLGHTLQVKPIAWRHAVMPAQLSPDGVAWGYFQIHLQVIWPDSVEDVFWCESDTLRHWQRAETFEMQTVILRREPYETHAVVIPRAA